MNLERYTELTGKVIPESKKDYYNAQIKRIQTKLETILGYTLEPQDLYIELGKTQKECVCPNIPESSSLLPSDAVRGIYKVFPYNSKDRFLHIDPFIDVYNVKLVKVLDNHQFITFKTFENFTKQYMTQGIGNYIEKCLDCSCDCGCKNCVQLAVDADWVDFTEEISQIPNDLMYLWCDMIDYYSDLSKDIKSESVDGHSWSRGDIEAPEKTETAQLLLRRYAGPYGSIVRTPTI